MSVLTVLENIKNTRLKFSQGSITVSWKMPNYEEVGVKLTNTQLHKLKSAAKTKAGTTLRKTIKKLQDKELPHSLILTTRQRVKTRNTFANNMSTHIKLSEAQLSKIIQSIGFLGNIIGILSTDERYCSFD